MVKKNIINLTRLSKPTFNNNTILEIKKIFKSGNLVQGVYVNKFEKIICQYLNARYTVVVSSGTSALHLSLLALGIRRGDEVIIPAFSYIATANVIELVGASPILVDIDLDNYCIDPKKIEKKITNKTKAIMPVHEFGNVADLKEILKIANKYKIPVIEDSACAIGSSLNNKKVGTFGDFGCFSFHPRKLITTGEGGAIIFKDKKFLNKLRYLRNHGIKINKFNNSIEGAGFNYRMTEFQAAIGIEQIKKLNKILKHNQKLGIYYFRYLKDINWINFPKIKNSTKVNFQSFHIILHKSINRNNLIKFLKFNQIEANLGAQAIHSQKFYKKKYKFKNIHFPNAYKAYTKGLVLPIGLHISIGDVKKITNTIKLFKVKKYK